MKRYGIFDTKDKLWMGNGQGPLIFDKPKNGVPAETLARAAATVINEQFGCLARYRAMRINKGPFLERDKVTAQKTGAQALKVIMEKGHDWKNSSENK